MSEDSLAFLRDPNDFRGADAVAVYVGVEDAYREAKRRVRILADLLDQKERELDAERERAITAETAMIRKQVFR